jgi:hypothetical protein
VTGQQKLLRALLIIWPVALVPYLIGIFGSDDSTVIDVVGVAGGILFDIAILTTVAYGVSRLIAWLSPQNSVL